MADDELPPPRSVRWELPENQFACLWVPGGAHQRDRPLPTARRRAKTRPPNLMKHQILQPQYKKGSRAPFQVRP